MASQSSGNGSHASVTRWSNSLRDQFYRRMSMVVIIVHTLIIPASMVGLGLIMTFPLFWPLLGLYALIIFLDPRPERGVPLQWLQRWCRRSWWWKAFAYYYPITLHKTVDLPPSDPPLLQNGWLTSLLPWSWRDTPLAILLWPVSLVYQLMLGAMGRRPPVAPASNGRKYIFGISPHGIISMGAFCALNTEGANWSHLFPGVPVRLLTLSSNFYFPFYRQYLLATGVASVSKQSCVNLLNNNQNIGIVLGGARESLFAEPNKFDIILHNRKGFVKIALQTGATIVPVISFGENNVYEQVRFPPGSLGYKVHLFMTKHLGFTIPLFHARGVFDYDSGVIAYRRPIDVVVGAPIDVPLESDPTQDQIDAYHALYVRELKQLYADNVNKFTPGVELRIVE